MIAVVASKWVADAFGKGGIYAAWIALRQYPWLPPDEYRDHGETAAHIMKPARNLVVIHDEDGEEEACTVRALETMVETYTFHGFPVVSGGLLRGYIVRDKLKACVGM